MEEEHASVYNEEIHIKLDSIYNKIYQDVGYISSGVYAPSIKGKSNFELWNLFVPLTSDLRSTLKILDGKLYGMTVTTDNGYEVCGVENGKLINEKSNIDSKSLALLYNKINDFVIGDTDSINGLKILGRPLIASPVWKDGVKNNFFSLDVSSSLNVFKHVVLLGQPGSGKSTIAKIIACAYIRRFLNLQKSESISKIGLWPDDNRLPVFIEVKKIVSSDFFPAINEKVNINTFLIYLKNEYLDNDENIYNYFLNSLSKGLGILIFDGLDEISVPENIPDALDLRRAQIQSLFDSISRQFPLSKIIVTSRPAGYSGWVLNTFDTVHIMPVNEIESRSIIISLFLSYNMSRSDANKKATYLIDHLYRIPKAIREQPLFVVLLAILYYKNQNQQLPIERGALLKHSINLLLTSWSIKRAGADSIATLFGCSEESLISHLENIAYKSLDSEYAPQGIEDQYIPRALILDELFELGNSVNIVKILSYISENAGILTSPAPKKYKFAHRLFHEYLAASKLSKSNSYIKELLDKLNASFHNWQEVVFLLADVLSDTLRRREIWDLVESLANENDFRFIWLASRVLLDQNLVVDKRVSNIAVANQLRDKFIKTMTSLELQPIKKIDIAKALSVIGDFRPGVGLNREYLPDIRWCIIEKTDKIIGITDEQKNILKQSNIQDWQFKREAPSFKYISELFFISKYPVTISQFSSFVNHDNGYYFHKWWTNKGLAWRNEHSPPPPTGLTENCPQNYVTWYEAVAFCNWLSFYLQESIRLPTEVEWEVASKINQDSIYPWGHQFNSIYANTREAGYNCISPVGCFNFNNDTEFLSFPQDMIGNLWEWCSSIVEDINGKKYNYPYDSSDGREQLDVEDTAMRATRGGYYMSDAFTARCSYRGRDLEDVRLARQGFRIVKSK
jgi:formylglycine-generating enzyme required for sulfatase activity/energy-coupling factor transporter ATP-binding protein EcfA2